MLPPVMLPPVMLPRAYMILVGSAAAVIVAAGIGATAWLVAPAFLAWVIVVVIAPVGHRLRAYGLPAWLATGVLVVLVYAVVVVMAGVVVLSAARLATVLPQYAAEADGLRRGLGTLLATYGIGPDQVRAVVADLDIGKVAGYVGLLLAGLAGLATNLVFLLSLLLFISIETSGADARLAVLITDRPLLGAYVPRPRVLGLAARAGGRGAGGAADPPGQGGTRGQRPTGGLGGGLVGLTASRARPVVTGSRT